MGRGAPVGVAAHGGDEGQPVEVPIGVGHDPSPHRHGLAAECERGGASAREEQADVALRLEDRHVLRTAERAKLLEDLSVALRGEVPPRLAREVDQARAEVRAQRGTRAPRLAEEETVDEVVDGAPREGELQRLGLSRLEDAREQPGELLHEHLVQVGLLRHDRVQRARRLDARLSRDHALHVQVLLERMHRHPCPDMQVPFGHALADLIQDPAHQGSIRLPDVGANGRQQQVDVHVGHRLHHRGIRPCGHRLDCLRHPPSTARQR